MIGGQALIEGIMMRGPEKDAVAVRISILYYSIKGVISQAKV